MALARAHYETHPATWTRDIKVIHSLITRENVNAVIGAERVPEEVDFFSLDIDGIDWWVWKALECVRPRVVAVEYNASFGPELSVTIPYRPDFVRDTEVGLLHGASLRAFVKLGREKGYRLVGCNSTGANAFFVRDDLAKVALPEVSIEAGYRQDTYRNRRMSFEEQRAILAKADLVTV